MSLTSKDRRRTGNESATVKIETCERSAAIEEFPHPYLERIVTNKLWDVKRFLPPFVWGDTPRAPIEINSGEAGAGSGIRPSFRRRFRRGCGRHRSRGR